MSKQTSFPFARFLGFLLVFMLLAGSAAAESAAVLWADLNDPFSATTRVCLEELLQGSDVTLTHYDALYSQWTQMDQIEEALDAHADLIFVQSCEYASASAARALLGPIQDAGIPVVFFGRQIAANNEKIASLLAGYDKSLYVHHDSIDIGRTQGVAAGMKLASDFGKYDLNGDGWIATVVLKGDPMDTDAENRAVQAVTFANEILAESGLAPLAWFGSDSPLVMADPNCMWSADFARDTIAELLKTNGPKSGQMIELILCGNDDMANGAVNALFHVDYNTDLEGSPAIPIYGVDGTLLAQELIEKNRMTGTVIRSATNMAVCMVSAMRELLTGEEQTYDAARREGQLIFPAYEVIQE